MRETIARRLHASYISGDDNAREKLIDLLVPVACTTADMIAGKNNVDIEDIREESVVAMIEAIDTYDTRHNVKLHSYVIGCCQHRVRKVMSSNSNIPRRTLDAIKVVTIARTTLVMNMVSMPTSQQVMDSSGLDERTFLKAETANRLKESLSLDEVFDDGKTTISDFVKSDCNISEQTEHKEMLRLIDLYIDRLPENEKRIVKMFYFECVPMSDIARAIGISDALAYRLHTQSVLRLRAFSVLQAELFTTQPH